MNYTKRLPIITKHHIYVDEFKDVEIKQEISDDQV